MFDPASGSVCILFTPAPKHHIALAAGLWAYRAAWVYGSLCMAVFMVRTMKRVIFYESRQYSRPRLSSVCGSGAGAMPMLSALLRLTWLVAACAVLC